MSTSAVQKRLRVGGDVILRHPPDHAFVTCGFDVAAKDNIRQPAQRIEPMHREDQKRKQLPPRIAAADMLFFMQKYVFLRLIRESGRQIDLRTEQTENKRRAYLVAKIDPVPVPHRGADAVFCAKEADEQEREHADDADDPQDRSGVLHDLQRIRAGSRIRRKPLGDDRIDRLVDGRNARVDRGFLHDGNIAWNRLCGRNQTQYGFQRKRKNEP